MTESICIDEMIDKNKCPSLPLCTIATTCYDREEKERTCYHCWKSYCKENGIEIAYKEVY